MRELGGSLGIALMGALVVARETDRLKSGASHAAAFTDGFSLALWTSAGAMALRAVIAVFMLGARSRRDPELAPTFQRYLADPLSASEP